MKRTSSKSSNQSYFNPFKNRSHLRLCFFTFITFGIYGIFLTFRWIRTLNKVRNKKIINITKAIIISILTIGIGFYFYYWRMMSEYELIVKEKIDLVIDRENLLPPVKYVKEAVVIFGIISVILEFTTIGLSIPATLFIDAYLLIQSKIAIDYALELKARAEKIES